MRTTSFILMLFCLPFVALAQEYLSQEDFKQKVWDYEASSEIKIKSDVPVVLDFFATWCGPCKRMDVELEKLQRQYGDKLKVYRIDVDASRELASLFGISAMPTVYFIRVDGSGTYVLGYRTFDELKQIVDTYLFSTQRSWVSFGTR